MPSKPPSSTPREPLGESAAFARHTADALCEAACRDYHGMWQYFRLIGLISTIGSNSDFFVDTLQGLAHPERGRRVLISATADYGMLAHVLHAFRQAGVRPEITVLDRCPTPLALNRWYAAREGIEIRCWQGSIADFHADEAFDVVCTHSFLGRLSDELRDATMRTWLRVLRPGGHVVTAARVRHGAPREGLGFSPEEAAAFRARALQLALPWRDRLDLSPQQIAEAAGAYAAAKRTRGFDSPTALRTCFEAAGFTLQQFDPGSAAERAGDRPSGPVAGLRSERYRIVAAKP